MDAPLIHKQSIFSCPPSFWALVMIFAGAALGAEYTLEQILQHAGKRADEVKKIEVSYREGLAQMRVYRSEAMPMITFSTGVSLASQSLAAQFDSFGSGSSAREGGGAPPLDSITDPYARAAIAGLLGALESFRFSPQSRQEGVALNWNVGLVQPLITFGKVRSALRAANLRADMLKDKRRLDYDLFYLSVLGAFSSALAAQNDVAIAQKGVEQSEKMLKLVTANAHVGLASELDRLRAEALTYQRSAEHLNAVAVHATAVARLTQLCGIDTAPGISLSLGQSTLHQAPEAVTNGQSRLCALDTYFTGLKESEASYERSKIFPAVYLVGGVSNQYQITEGNNRGAAELFDTDLISYYVGLNLTWTIFDGFRTPSRYREVKHQLEQQRIAQKQNRERNQIEIDDAARNIEVLQKNLAAARKNYEAVEKARLMTDREYQAGRTDITTLLDIDRQARGAEKMVSDLNVLHILAIANLKLALGQPLFGEYP